MKISSEKKEKISEQILAFLYSVSPQSRYTSHIAREIARDEEFIKIILQGLKKKGLILEVKKNPNGKTYIKRQRWALSDRAYKAYHDSQYSQNK
jgi:predicted transcriptional regulator with HTH domain